MKYRTDLAIECNELLAEHDNNASGNGKIEFQDGISFRQYDYMDTVKITDIHILNSEGEKSLGKPKGKYITIETNKITEAADEEKNKVAMAVSRVLESMIPFHDRLKVLVVGLGNEKITPDSLGPKTVAKVAITRHVFLYLNATADNEMSCVSGIAPGVMGTTGIESLDIIKKTVEIVNPEYIIIIDSLAAKNIERVSTTIQINDYGIAPGAGIGNNRKELSENSLGKKVIAIGVPTVIDSKTMVMEAFDYLLQDDSKIDEYICNKIIPMIVTPTDIDLIIKDFSEIIAKGINNCLHPGI